MSEYSSIAHLFFNPSPATETHPPLFLLHISFSATTPAGTLHPPQSHAGTHDCPPHSSPRRLRVLECGI
ncbi:unnamed protein product [Citrullus colocynthis]|uniref:Uncharacterized protein n=1 Tax=Citrullus colocynthis TaxID=252529 RepID=A0ABP0Z656_9ROSI